MRFAVDLDDEAGDVAVEVDREGAGGMLSAEFKVFRPSPERLPEDNFGTDISCRKRRARSLPPSPCNILNPPLQGEVAGAA